MTQFTLATVVEGHGEVECLPLLVRMIQPSWNVPRPLRGKRQRLPKDRGKNIEHYVRMARANIEGTHGGILVVIDADDDCPAELGPSLLDRCRIAAPDVQVAVVLAMQEFEVWFISGKAVDIGTLENLEQLGSPKSAVKRALDGRYSETIDMPKLVNKMNIQSARTNSQSFDKFMRCIEYFEETTA
ncbi:MAG: hypothetical protein JKX70_08145 [Phycisphaerales bacterium]|nr:hypothetical protein [Phycisphaerales bacterium]